MSQLHYKQTVVVEASIRSSAYRQGQIVSQTAVTYKHDVTCRWENRPAPRYQGNVGMPRKGQPKPHTCTHACTQAHTQCMQIRDTVKLIRLQILSSQGEKQLVLEASPTNTHMAKIVGTVPLKKEKPTMVTDFHYLIFSKFLFIITFVSFKLCQ